MTAGIRGAPRYRRRQLQQRLQLRRVLCEPEQCRGQSQLEHWRCSLLCLKLQNAPRFPYPLVKMTSINGHLLVSGNT